MKYSIKKVSVYFSQWWQVGPLNGIWSLLGTFGQKTLKSGPFFVWKVPFPMIWSLFQKFELQKNKIDISLIDMQIIDFDFADPCI